MRSLYRQDSFQRIVSTILVFVILINPLAGVLHLESVLAVDHGVPWYDVQIADTVYTVNLDLVPGQSISGPLDEDQHATILEHVYVIDKSTQQPVTDPIISQRATLLAQNRAIVNTSSNCMNHLHNVTHAVFYGKQTLDLAHWGGKSEFSKTASVWRTAASILHWSFVLFQ